PQRLGNAHPSIAPYDLFAPADRPMIVAVGNDAQFRRLAEVLQRPDLADNPDYRTHADRAAHRHTLKADIERVLRTHGADDSQRPLTASGIPCGPINPIEQAFDQASRLGRDPVVDAGGMPVVVNPVKYTRTPPQYRSAPPQGDADRAEVLALLRE